MEENVKKETEHSSTKNYVIIISVIFVFFIIGYWIGARFLVPKPKNEEEPFIEVMETEVDIDDPEISHLISQLVAGGDCWNIDTYCNDHKVTTKNLPIERIFQVTELASFYSKGIESVSLEDFDTEIQMYFDTGYTFNPETMDFTSQCFQYTYDLETQRFIKNSQVCEATCGANSSQYMIERALKKEDSLLIYVKVLFGSQAESTNFFRDFERTEVVTNDYENIESYMDQGKDYVFTFQMKEDHYIFISSEAL
ncbi:MAG: hypothetical protein J6X28_01000 [Bacilli bacterium]|nr:hypothetical protein [Bacilli bacterium]